MTTTTTTGTAPRTGASANALLFGGREAHPHILAVPFWLFIIRIFQGLLALVTLALSAFGLSTLGYILSGGYGLNIFTSIYTFIFLGYILGTPYFAPGLYNYWAHLGLEIAAWIFWLSTWALLASTTAYYSVYWRFTGTYSAAKGATGGAAGLGAIVWLLLCVTLIYLSISLYRHRKANGHSSPNAIAMEQGLGGAPVVAQSYPVAPAGEQYKGPVISEQNHLHQQQPQQYQHQQEYQQQHASAPIGEQYVPSTTGTYETHPEVVHTQQPLQQHPQQQQGAPNGAPYPA